MSGALTLPATPYPRARRWLRPRSAIPGFGVAFGYTLLYLGLIVLLPLAALVLKASEMGVVGWWSAVSDERVVAALKTSFGLSFAAAALDSAFGLLIAWVLTRYRFPGRKILDAMLDLPFALPTAVAGIALTAIYAPTGWIGQLGRAARPQDRLHAGRNLRGARLRRPSLCRAHGRAAHRRSGPRARGGFGDAGGDATGKPCGGW